MKLKKSLAVYAYFDKEGEWTKEANYYVLSLFDLFEEVIVVSNGKLHNFPRENLPGLFLIERENIGFDFGAWKDAILSRRKSNIQSLSYLCLCNSSTFGPIYDLKKTFSLAEQKKWDFWGLTQHPRLNDVAYHIQSYFIVFRGPLLRDFRFFDYWVQMKYPSSWTEAVRNFEIPLTQDMQKIGASVGVVYPFPDLSEKESNPLLLYAPEILLRGLPFIKKKVFTENYQYFFARGDGNEAKKVTELLKNINPTISPLIDEYLIKKVKPSRSRYSVHSTILLPNSYLLERRSDGRSLMKIGIICSVFYDDSIHYSQDFLIGLDDSIDLCIVSSNSDLLNQYKCLLYLRKNTEFRLMKNRGRNEAAYFVICRDFIEKFDLICFLHDKKSSHAPHPHLGESWMNFCFANLIPSNEFIENVRLFFSNHPTLGMAFPPPPLFGSLADVLLEAPWGGNKEVAFDIAKKMHIKATLDDEPMAPYGGMFWARRSALQPLMDLNLCQEDFPEEPLRDDRTILHVLERLYPQIAQTSGFSVSWLLSTAYAPTYINNLFFNLKETNTLNKQIERKVVSFVRNKLISHPWLYLLSRKIYRIIKQKFG